jgi:hypothetical protein
MDSLDTIKARIRALMARTTANGCTEAEAMAAAQRAMNMMREHGLSPDLVECSEHRVRLGRMKLHPVDRLWGAVALVCRCQVWRHSNGQDAWIVYFGRDPWPEIAAWLHSVIQGAHDRGLREYRKTPAYKARRTAKTRAAWAKAWSEGFVLGVARQLDALLLPSEDAAREADLKLAERALEKRQLAFGKAKPLPAMGTDRRLAAARGAGHSSGRGTQLNWGVGQTEQLKIGRA